MINKVVGYGGYKSYADCPYPTIKQGKDLEAKNEVWSSTKRDADKVNTLDNFNHYHTVYKKNHVENTEPKDYHPEHVQKGSSSTLNFAGTSLVKPYDQAEAEKDGQPSYRNGFNLLKTGTEHWKSNYQGSVCQSAANNANNSTISRPDSSNKKSGQSNIPGQSNKPGQSSEELSKALSYKNRPYINDVKTGITDYKFNYGQKIGNHPKQILNETSLAQPIRDHPLKHGTNQLWTEIPGYMGFKPSEVPFEEVKDKMEKRREEDRGNKKLQLGDNYHTNIPGYGGYKPMINVGKSEMRQTCFEYKS